MTHRAAATARESSSCGPPATALGPPSWGCQGPELALRGELGVAMTSAFHSVLEDRPARSGHRDGARRPGARLGVGAAQGSVHPPRICVETFYECALRRSPVTPGRRRLRRDFGPAILGSVFRLVQLQQGRGLGAKAEETPHSLGWFFSIHGTAIVVPGARLRVFHRVAGGPSPGRTSRCRRRTLPSSIDFVRDSTACFPVARTGSGPRPAYSNNPLPSAPVRWLSWPVRPPASCRGALDLGKWQRTRPVRCLPANSLGANSRHLE